LRLASRPLSRRLWHCPGCPLSREAATAPIKPVFPSTGWRTVALDHIVWQVLDDGKEAALYIALSWKLRTDDSSQAVLDIGDWGSAIFQHAPVERATVESFCLLSEPWNAAAVEAELRKRGLTPAENDGRGFESFHVKHPNGWNLQDRQWQRPRASPSHSCDRQAYRARTRDSHRLEDCLARPHLLPRHKLQSHEGSQHEPLIGDIIIRGGNPHAPNFAQSAAAPSRRPRVDHISFGIARWDTDAVKGTLERHGLHARIDTSTHDDIHVAAYKSYRTTTPNGFDLQISGVNRESRLALSNAVKPK
jgi:hypothetical protein